MKIVLEIPMEQLSLIVETNPYYGEYVDAIEVVIERLKQLKAKYKGEIAKQNLLLKQELTTLAD